MGTGRAEAEWLDFVAELLAAPPPALPVERIALRLATTWDSPACAFDRLGGRRPVRTVWQRAHGPGRAHTLLRRGEWDAFYRSIGADYRLSIPIDVAPGSYRRFVLGRTAPYTVAEHDFAATVQRVLSGIDRQIAGRSSAGATDRLLTPRETDVLAQLATGMTAAAVARRLAIAERTVHKHLQRAYGKLGVSDRLSAVLRAQRLGLLD